MAVGGRRAPSTTDLKPTDNEATWFRSRGFLGA
jgi:hypothetical protein